jgi:hypothetical protein
MRETLILAAFCAAIGAFGCGTQQPDQLQSQSQLGQSQSQVGGVSQVPDSQLVIAPKVADVPAHPLPFKGKLISGDPAELPPAVAMSLSDSSPVTFTYREELTHDDYHIPLLLSAVDPGSWVGNPTGDIGVTAFASLSISSGDTIIGDYTAKEHVSKSYSLYTQASHKEVDDAARVAVRQRLDQKIYADEARLAQAAASAPKSAAASVVDK